MSETRSTFKTGVSAVIYNNTQKLIKGNTVRDKFLVMADSVLFFEEGNVPGGYLEINETDLNVDVSFIKSTSPAGKYLKDNGTWSSVDSLPTQTGNSGKFLTTNGSSASWAAVDSFPTQTGNSGKFLTTNGSVVSWAAVDPLPTQTGNSGKFLTTNGSSASWATVDSLPTQSGHSGKFLTTNGSSASWATMGPAGADNQIQFYLSGAFAGSTRFVWENSNRYFKADGSGLFGLNVTNDPTAYLDIAPATTGQASLRIRDTTSEPTSPNSGDIWQDDTDIWIHIGGNNRKFALI